MGGRIAGPIADEAGAKGLVCLGCTFYGPGRTQQPRLEHLRNPRTPTFIVQGSSAVRRLPPGHRITDRFS